jgi:hypothetical protein
MKKINYSCPVPKEQQPMYEYKSLKNSIFFFWTTEDLKSYLSKVVILIILNYIIFGILLSIANPLENNIIKHLIVDSLIVTSLLILFLIRIYLGWDYIFTRLKKATVSYEESGWYDGQIWIKTPDMLLKDRLVADYILLPILKRIKITLTILITYLTIGLFNTY